MDANKINIEAIIKYDIDMNRLCKFACQYGYCPEDVCKDKGRDVAVITPDYEDARDIRDQNGGRCLLYRDNSYQETTFYQYKTAYRKKMDETEGEDSVLINYGYIGKAPSTGDIEWM